ncbi:MAG: hypothetical protein R3D86_00695 [Emcibacteraceae bacterium]
MNIKLGEFMEKNTAKKQIALGSDVTAQQAQAAFVSMNGPFKSKKFKFHQTDPKTRERKVMELEGKK